jgi:hypothetical protein
MFIGLPSLSLRRWIFFQELLVARLIERDPFILPTVGAILGCRMAFAMG